jgi:hypothetical protein
MSKIKILQTGISNTIHYIEYLKQEKIIYKNQLEYIYNDDFDNDFETDELEFNIIDIETKIEKAEDYLQFLRSELDSIKARGVSV